MSEQVEELKQKALQELEGIDSVKHLESWRVHYLGKKSPLTQVLRNLATLPIEERKAVGAAANQLKTLLEDSAEQRGQVLVLRPFGSQRIRRRKLQPVGPPHKRARRARQRRRLDHRTPASSGQVRVPLCSER